MTTIQDYLTKALEARHGVIERACERAIQGGHQGVVVLNHEDGRVEAWPSILVPYGRMVDMPAKAWEPWLANGCPC